MVIYTLDQVRIYSVKHPSHNKHAPNDIIYVNAWNCKGRGYSLFSKLKGALDKYNIYLFISYSVENFKLHQHPNFQLILPMHFHFMRYFVNSIIFRVSHKLVLCIYWSRLWKIENVRNIHTASKVNQFRT